MTSNQYKAITAIRSERKKQLSKYPISKDKRYKDNELIRVANAVFFKTLDENWPSKWSKEYYKKYMLYSRIRQLRIAGALVLAHRDADCWTMKQKEFFQLIIDELAKQFNT